MSSIENVVQASIQDRQMSHRLQRIPCGRCYAVVEYDRGTEWRVVNELVNEHWKTCPGKPHARLTQMAYTPTSPPHTTIVLSPPVASKQRSSSNSLAESTDFLGNTWISVCGRKRRTLEQRKLGLEQDEYTKCITAKSVVCVGCRKEISLDKRSKYYPGLWLKHKGKCPDIEKLERAKAPLKLPQLSNGTRQEPCSVVIPGSGDSGCRDSALKLGPTEPHESRDAAATHQLVDHYESEVPSSDDEDEDEDAAGGSPPQEPFPTLNSDFYSLQRRYNRSDEWIYRYATKDEITTNLFRGQDEPYARLDGRYFTHLSLQTRDGSRCVIGNRVENAPSLSDSSRSSEELSEPVAPHTLPWYTTPSTYK